VGSDIIATLPSDFGFEHFSGVDPASSDFYLVKVIGKGLVPILGLDRRRVTSQLI